MLPPGNSSGRTTNVSVETASRPAATSTIAASVNLARAGLEKWGRKRSFRSAALILPPEPCPSWTLS